MKKISFITIAVSAFSIFGATIHVSPDATCGGNGSKSAPFNSIQQALNVAMPGDTVELAPGVYYERVKFPRSGEYKKPIRLNGPRTAIIDGSDKVELKWEKCPEFGSKAWRTPVPEQFFAHKLPSGLVVSRDGLIIQLFENRITDSTQKPVKRERDTVWEKKILFEQGIGKTKWELIKALAMYRKTEKDLIVAFGDGRDISKEGLILSAPIPAISINGVDRCVVSGITIRHAWRGVYIANSCGSVVEDCRILKSDGGVEMVSGAKQCTVRFCEISMDPNFTCDPFAIGSWDAWRGHKFGGFWDRIGINMLYTIGGHHIHDNYIHDHWGGIQDIGNPGDNLALNVHHNRIDKIEDDGLEPDGGEEYSRWHHNFVTRSRCGFRIKCIRKGPLFAYKNVFHGNKEDFRNFGTKNLAKADVFIYHNTSITRAAVNNNAVPKEIGTPNYHYYNNLFICDIIFSGTYAMPDWHDAGNVYLQNTPSSEWQKVMDNVLASGFKSSSRFLTSGKAGIVAPEIGNFEITPDSVAVKAATDISKFNLPGMEANLKLPDTGALQLGEKMFKVYRSPKDIEVVPAGFSPEQNEKIIMPEQFAKGFLKF